MTLHEYLAREQINVAELARRLEVDGSTVWRWVVGKRLPSMALLPRIEKVTGGAVRAKDFYPSTAAAE
jgi:transcriptional regulator with XRE-family HTH domain